MILALEHLAKLKFEYIWLNFKIFCKNQNLLQITEIKKKTKQLFVKKKLVLDNF